MVARTAFLFPGQGSQSVGMGKTYFESSSAADEIFTKADKQLGYSLSELMFNGPEEKLKDTSITQPALFVASAAALERLKEKNIEPSAVAGHSLGEYSALYAAGVLSFEDALRLVQERGRAMQAAATQAKGTMAAVLGLDGEKVRTICKEVSAGTEVCVGANFNSDTQIVISGSEFAVNAAAERAKLAGAAKVVMLNVAGAFHSPLMQSAADQMQKVLQSARFSNARCPVYTNIDAQGTTSSSDFSPKLVRQITGSVLWHDTLKNLISAGFDNFIEVGSGKVLSALIKKLDRKKAVGATDEFESVLKIFETPVVQ